ncbi:MAG TPA: ABC transporter substrate-binding protein, partial [Chloroflexia bacterium]|nr:ABC transporter substrate-binding protein [Chloroflexia bacterium]
VNPGGQSESIDPHKADYSADATRWAALQPDLVYFGGVTENHAPQVLQALRNVGFTGSFMGADGIGNDDFIKQAAGATNGGGIFSTLVGLPAAQLKDAGHDWYLKYSARFPEDKNPDFAPFGYEAGKVAIHAIAQVNRKDREAVRAAVAATKSDDLPGKTILGNPWAFDANGDTSLVTISVQQLESNAWGYKGVMIYDPATKQWALQGGQ